MMLMCRLLSTGSLHLEIRNLKNSSIRIGNIRIRYKIQKSIWLKASFPASPYAEVVRASGVLCLFLEMLYVCINLRVYI